MKNGVSWDVTPCGWLAYNCQNSENETCNFVKHLSQCALINLLVHVGGLCKLIAVLCYFSQMKAQEEGEML
jgi:hypothetical protein